VLPARLTKAERAVAQEVNPEIASEAYRVVKPDFGRE
jgi:hypothetical protein